MSALAATTCDIYTVKTPEDKCSGFRRLALVHSIVIFCFNTVLLALTIGIVSNLL